MTSLAGLSVDLSQLEGLSEEERAAVQADLDALEKAYRDNPLLGYRPHPKQVVFHSPAQPPIVGVGEGVIVPGWPPVRAFFGGNRSGKTTAAVLDTLIQAVDVAEVPPHLRAFKRWEPPFKARVMTPDFGSTYEVVLEKIRDWVPRSQLWGGSFEKAFDKQQRILRFKNGSRLHFNSNVQDREQLGGMSFHRIVYDEEPRQDLRNESAMRVADVDGEEIFAMTPFEGMAWVYDEMYEPWELLLADGLDEDEIEEQLELRVVVVDMDDNPSLSERGKVRALAKYSGPEREARKTGRFVSFSGLIYPQWDESRHVLPDEDEIPAGVECFEGVDPGLRVMAAVVFCYLDFEDRLVVYDELALQGQTVKTLVEQVKQKRKDWGVKPAWSVLDPAARNKNPQTGRSDQSEFQRHGLAAFLGQNDVRPGINAVIERLEADSLLVCARCKELRKEFRRYRWQRVSTRTEDDPKPRPVKRDDHLLDALRYVTMQRPLAPKRPREREQLSTKDRMLKAHFDRLKRLSGRRHHNAGAGPVGVSPRV